MAVNTNNILHLAAGMFGLAPSKSLLDVFKSFDGNDAQFAAAVGTLPYTAQFYAGNNQAKAAKLVDMLGGKLLAADMKAAATGYVVGLLNANGGNVGSAAAEAIKFVLADSSPALAAVKAQMMNRAEVAKAYSEKMAEGLDLQLVGMVTDKTASKDAVLQKINGSSSGGIVDESTTSSPVPQFQRPENLEAKFQFTMGSRDKLVGTKNNDYFVAEDGTLVATDSVKDDNAEDNDTLEIVQTAGVAAKIAGIENIYVRGEFFETAFNASNTKGAHTLLINTDNPFGTAGVTNVTSKAVSKVIAGDNLDTLTVASNTGVGTGKQVEVEVNKVKALTLTGDATGVDNFKVNLHNDEIALSTGGGTNIDVLTLQSTGKNGNVVNLSDALSQIAAPSAKQGAFVTGTADLQLVTADTNVTGKKIAKKDFSGKLTVDLNLTTDADLKDIEADLINITTGGNAAVNNITVNTATTVKLSADLNGADVLNVATPGALKLVVAANQAADVVTTGANVKALALSVEGEKGTARTLTGIGAATLSKVTVTGAADLTTGAVTMKDVAASKLDASRFTGNLNTSLVNAGQIIGGSGNDTLAGAAGKAITIMGGAGNDTITGSTDTASQLDGGDGNDTITGSSADDKIFGGAGNDTIDGSGGADIIDGGAGNDTITAGAGDDKILGGDGNDTITTGDGVNKVLAGAGNDTITGGAGKDTILGEDGNDTIDGDAEADTIDGGAGNDSLKGSAGNDSIIGGLGNDTITGGADNDMLFGGAGNDTLKGDAGNDMLDGGDGDDLLQGGAGVDTLVGGAGNDVLEAGATGANVLTGGTGADTFVIGTAATSIGTITDFNAGQGDKLKFDISVYTAYAGNTAEAGKAVELVFGRRALNELMKEDGTNYEDMTGKIVVLETDAQVTAFNAGSGAAAGAIAISKESGKVYYDADGNFSAGAVEVANIGVAGVEGLTAANFEFTA